MRQFVFPMVLAVRLMTVYLEGVKKIDPFLEYG